MHVDYLHRAGKAAHKSQIPFLTDTLCKSAIVQHNLISPEGCVYSGPSNVCHEAALTEGSKPDEGREAAIH